MRGTRASTDRQRLTGKACYNCKRSLPEPHTPGKKWCKLCRLVGQVLMNFRCSPAGIWTVVYREVTMRPLPRASRFRSPDKLRKMFSRFAPRQLSEDCKVSEYGLQNGRGMVELDLTEAFGSTLTPRLRHR